MNKVALVILGCIFGLITADTITSNDDAEEGSIPCKYTDELWGTTDGTKFYFCLPTTNTAIIQSCPEGTFFVRNATLTGCIPNDLMEPNCVYDMQVGPCTGVNLKQPQPSADPNTFYLCPSEDATPLLLPCAEGKAFVKQNGYLGCFDWSVWRDLRQCYTLTNQI